MPSTSPSTREELLRTGKVAPEFAEAWKAMPMPPGSSYTMDDLKILNELGLPARQNALAESRPADMTESEHAITLRDGHQSRVLICHKSTAPPSGKSPLIVLLYGGGHCCGTPETEVPLARALAQAHDAVVVLPSYRLAPKYLFPHSINDTWDSLCWVALESTKTNSNVLPSWTNAHFGFIVGGISAGSGLSSTVAHIARDNNLKPPLTGQFLSCGSVMSPDHVPPKYKQFYLAREQNANAPILDADMFKLFHDAFKPDHTSPLWACFDQHHPEDADGEVKMGHIGLPPAYFQVCGMDMSRDDGLIYEKVLREECGVQTRLDLYEGYPHCWWSIYPKLAMSERRMKDTVRGIGWLLELRSEN